MVAQLNSLSIYALLPNSLVYMVSKVRVLKVFVSFCEIATKTATKDVLKCAMYIVNWIVYDRTFINEGSNFQERTNEILTPINNNYTTELSS